MQHFFVRVFATDDAANKPLPVTFDAALAALAELPRLFIEPDGSFVWTSPPGEAAWQVDGMLVDGGETLYYCELKGSCPSGALDQVVAAVSGNATPQFEMVEEGTVLGEGAFRRQFTLPPNVPVKVPDRPE